LYQKTAIREIREDGSSDPKPDRFTRRFRPFLRPRLPPRTVTHLQQDRCLPRAASPVAITDLADPAESGTAHV
jgi:hypothetical protein